MSASIWPPCWCCAEADAHMHNPLCARTANYLETNSANKSTVLILTHDSREPGRTLEPIRQCDSRLRDCIKERLVKRDASILTVLFVD